jgi:hypothetical protein
MAGKWRAMTLMSALLQDKDALFQFHKRMKISNVERETSIFIIQHREQFEQLQNISDSEILHLYKDLLLDRGLF